jgi:cellulose 1,4-beta-cellobiosidase
LGPHPPLSGPRRRSAGPAVSADTASTGTATFTVSAAGYPPVTVTGTEAAAAAGTAPAHVVNPFTGATWYVNPNYTAEVATSAAGVSGALAAQMTKVGQQPTGVWLDHIGAIYGGPDNSGRAGLQEHLQAALSQETGSTTILVPIVIYDLPNRDCAALASNGELTVSNNGLQDYEQDYINPIAQILSDYSRTGIRVVAVIEPDFTAQPGHQPQRPGLRAGQLQRGLRGRRPVRAQQAARDPERVQLRLPDRRTAVPG